LRLSEKGILASLALVLLAFSVIAVSRIFEVPGTSTVAGSWQAEVGFYLPFVLFTLVSTYHFLEWAKKHRRQAIVMVVVIVAIASLAGTATANAPRPALNSLTLQAQASTQQSQVTNVQFQREQASLQENIVKLRDALNSTPYFSTGFSSLTLIASAAAVILVLARMRRERRTTPAKIVTEPLSTDIHATNPRDAVIQCYGLATRYLMLSGVRVEDSDTPLDAFARIKGFEPSIAEPFWNLTLLFEEAKFSLHPISSTQADTASQYCKSISHQSLGGIR